MCWFNACIISISYMLILGCCLESNYEKSYNCWLRLLFPNFWNVQLKMWTIHIPFYLVNGADTLRFIIVPVGHVKSPLWNLWKVPWTFWQSRGKREPTHVVKSIGHLATPTQIISESNIAHPNGWLNYKTSTIPTPKRPFVEVFIIHMLLSS